MQAWFRSSYCKSVPTGILPGGTLGSIYYRVVCTFSKNKRSKIKECGNVSIYRRFGRFILIKMAETGVSIIVNVSIRHCPTDKSLGSIETFPHFQRFFLNIKWQKIEYLSSLVSDKARAMYRRSHIFKEFFPIKVAKPGVCIIVSIPHRPIAKMRLLKCHLDNRTE